MMQLTALMHCAGRFGDERRGFCWLRATTGKFFQSLELIRRDGRRGFQVEVEGFVFGASAPRRLCHEPRDAIRDDAQDALIGAGCGQVQADLGFHLDHPRGNLDDPGSADRRCSAPDGRPHVAACPPQPGPEHHCRTTACRHQNARRRACRRLMTNRAALA